MFTILILLLLQDSPKFSDNNYTLFSQRESFYVLKKDTLFKYKEDVWSATKHNLNLKNYEFNTVDNNNNNIYLIAEGGGKVLLFKNEKLEDISNSGFWESNYGSFVFINNDLIYSYGGYGHFNTSNQLIFYDKGSKEWFDIRANENYTNNRRRNVTGSFNNKTNELYIGLGNYNKNIYSDIIKFDFKTKKWNKYADVGKHFDINYTVVNNYKVPLIISSNKEEKITFDFKNKTYNIYEEENSAINSFVKIHYNRFTNQFFISKKNNGYSDLTIIEEKDFLKKIKSTHTFKKDLNKLTVFLGVSVALALVLILIIFRKKETVLLKLNKNLKKIKSEIDESDLIFFDKIFRSHPKAVKYQDLMDMLDNTLAYETKIKKIGAAKIRIDTVLCKYCKSNDSILQSKKNIHDSRIKEMFLKTD